MWPFGPARAGSIEVMFGKHGDVRLKGLVSPVFIVTVAAIVLSFVTSSFADIDHESDQVP